MNSAGRKLSRKGPDAPESVAGSLGWGLAAGASSPRNSQGVFWVQHGPAEEHVSTASHWLHRQSLLGASVSL